MKEGGVGRRDTVALDLIVETVYIYIGIKKVKDSVVLIRREQEKSSSFYVT